MREGEVGMGEKGNFRKYCSCRNLEKGKLDVEMVWPSLGDEANVTIVCVLLGHSYIFPYF